MYYLDITTNEIKELTTEHKELFDDLIAAIGREDYEDVGYILEDYPILAHALNEHGFTALKLAAGHHTPAGLEIVRVLMSYGADPYAEDEDHFTAIDNVNRITDQALKVQFCTAIGIDVNNIEEILDGILDARVDRIARAQVEAEYAAKKAAEEAKTDSDDSSDSVIAEAERYFNDPRVKAMHKTMDQIDIRVVTETTTGEEAREALESLYNKPEKASQLEFSVDEGISEIIASVFGTKKADVDMDTKQSILTSLADWLGVDLSQLAYLASLASGSGFLPFYHGSGDDDFDPSFGGGNSGVIFENPPELPENTYLVTILGNGTLVIADNSQ